MTLIAIDVKDGKPVSEDKLRKCVEVGNKLIEYYKMIASEL
jgi:hypothetical protein